MKSSIMPLELVRFESLNDIFCVSCHNPLDLHQPDGERPDQLLGTCPDCGAWYLIDAISAVMLPLPDIANIHHD